MNITVVGGGFAGVKTALELAKKPKNNITLITDKPDFQYYPALYEAATGGSHLQSWVPLKKIFAGKSNVKIVTDTITFINPDQKQLQSESGAQYDYETCIMALGSVTTYFGIEGLDAYAYGIKSADEISALKDHILAAIAENSPENKRYVVIGAGPTGVELAAAMGDYLKRLYRNRNYSLSGIQIDLVEAAPRILPKMRPESSQKVMRRLEKLGINVQTGKAVESANANSVTIAGEVIQSHTVIWTSGVANHPFYKNNSEHFELAKNGKVVVDEYMQARDGIYVIGDNAATQYSGLAQTALHDAKFVAANLERQHRGKKLKKYTSVLPVVVVPVGRRWAILEWHWIVMSGVFGAMMRRAADFIGYSDILPLGQALGVWRAKRQPGDEDILESEKTSPTIAN